MTLNKVVAVMILSNILEKEVRSARPVAIDMPDSLDASDNYKLATVSQV